MKWHRLELPSPHYGNALPGELERCNTDLTSRIMIIILRIYGDYYGDFDDDDENHHHHRQNQCGQQDNSKDLTHKVSISTPPSTKAGPAVYEAIRPDGETKGRLQVQTMSLLCPKSVVSILNVIDTSEISCNILGLIFHSTMPSCECWRGGGRGWG